MPLYCYCTVEVGLQYAATISIYLSVCLSIYPSFQPSFQPSKIYGYYKKTRELY